MKTAKSFISTALYILAVIVSVILALPKAIGIGFMAWAECLTADRVGCVNDGVPTDIKGLHAAFELAIKNINENIKKTQDLAQEAIETVRKEGTIHGEQNTKLTELGNNSQKFQDELKTISTRILEVEQKSAKKPSGEGERTKSIGQQVAESDQWKAAAAQADAKSMQSVNVGSFHKTAIYNATLNNSQPLVQQLRLPGIITPGLRRMTIRDLIPQNRTTSNLVEFASELLFTNNAAPQGGTSSPTENNGEGVTKPESALTFTLGSSPVITLAHWIPASRQVLADAPMLQGYIDGRLRWGLQYAEEDAILNGTGAAGNLNGLYNQATAFTGGVTNATALDTLLRAFTQVSLAYFEADGVVLHPVDWMNILLLKDTTGRYLFADPHGMESPRVWGKDVIATQSQAIGTFLAGAFSLAAEIFDREDATVRISEHHANFFVQNMVCLLAEERLALVVYRPTALVRGALSYAG